MPCTFAAQQSWVDSVSSFVLYGQSPYLSSAPEIAVDKIEQSMCSSDSGSPARSSHQADMCFDNSEALRHLQQLGELPTPSLLETKRTPPVQIKRQFYLQAGNTLYPSGVAVPEEAELNLTVDSKDNQWGKVIQPRFT